MPGVVERLARVHERIEHAALKAGRDPEGVRLLAVSKTHPTALIREAYAAGQRDFGENYLQELVRKALELEDLKDIRWHMIGHLQTNKAKLAAVHANVVHTVDSARVAQALGRRRALLRAEQASLGPLPVLVEVNVAREAQKAGCDPTELEAVLAAIEAEPSLDLSGLMTVPPHGAPAEARPVFDRLRQLRDAHGGARRLPELSMGMSHDFEEAILAGSTLVRVGTAIFGAREARTTGQP